MEFCDIEDIEENGDFFFFLEEKTHDEITNIIQQWKSNGQRSPLSSQEFGGKMTEQQQAQQILEQQQQHQLPQPPPQITTLSASPPGHKLDTRTFTRSKRRFVRPFDTNLGNRNDLMEDRNVLPELSNDIKQQNTKNMMNMNAVMTENLALNLEIGGLVTTIQNPTATFNQNIILPINTDASIEGGMSNSLITSADFTNINFLQSTNSLDFNGINNTIKKINNHNMMSSGGNNCNNPDEYIDATSVNDYKVLDSLTMSGDGTLIKDTHIGQIDDISLPLSHTTSGCTTMNNSTESMECSNYKPLQQQHPSTTTITTLPSAARIVTSLPQNKNYISENSLHDCTLSRNIIAPNDENIGEITCALVENSIYNCIQQNAGDMGDLTMDLLKIKELNLSKDGGNGGIIHNNSIIEQIQQLQNRTFEEKHCETPEHGDKSISAQMVQIYESTPHVGNVRYRDTATRFRESPQLINNMNLSPIYTSNTSSHTIIETPVTSHNNANITRVLLNDTVEREKSFNDMQNGTFLVDLNSNNNNLSIKDNDTFNSSQHTQNNVMDVGASTTILITGSKPSALTTIEIDNKDHSTNVLNIDCADDAVDVDVDLDVNDDDKTDNLLKVNQNEEEFENMLNEFSRVELNAEQKIKMRKSLESLKKRFHCNTNDHRNEVPFYANSNNEQTTFDGEQDKFSKEQQQRQISNNTVLANLTTVIQNPLEQDQDKDVFNSTPETTSTLLHQHHHHHTTTKTINNTLNTWTNENNNNNRERLLNRRSRLYDNVFQSSSTNPSQHNIMNETINLQVNENDGNDLNIQLQNKGNMENKTITNDNKMMDDDQRYYDNVDDDGHSNKDSNLENNEQNIQMQLSGEHNSGGAVISSTGTPISSYRANEKQRVRERERDRFKTIKINKSYDCNTAFNIDNEKTHTQSMNDGDTGFSNGNNDTDLRGPIDVTQDNYNNQNTIIHEMNGVDSAVMDDDVKTPPIDITITNISIPTTKTNVNYLTYRKSKQSRMQLHEQNFFEQTTPEESQQPYNQNNQSSAAVDALNLRKIGIHINSNSNLMKPLYNNMALKKIATFNKANSDDNLIRTAAPISIIGRLHTPLSSSHPVNTTQNISLNAMKSAAVHRVVMENHDSNRSNTAAGPSTESSTSMGFRSKSFSNLANNLMCNAGNKSINQNVPGSAGTTTTSSGDVNNLRPTFGFRKPHTKTTNKTNISRNPASLGGNLSTPALRQEQTATVLQQETEKSVFKVPKPIGGVRGLAIANTTSRPSSMPTAMSEKRAGGLIRPSSGYFSLHAMGRSAMQNSSDPEIDSSGRHSSTDSMSSSSSKNSAQGGSYLYKPLNSKLATTMTPSNNKSLSGANNVVSSKTNTKVATSVTPMMAKPSGLRPPSTIVKRSGLPRPSTMIKTVK